MKPAISKKAKLADLCSLLVSPTQMKGGDVYTAWQDDRWSVFMYTKITVMFCLDIALMNSSNEYKMEGKKLGYQDGKFQLYCT